MPISSTPYQLSFNLDLPEDEPGLAGLSADEIQARKDVAKAMLENPDTWPRGEDGKPEVPFWFEDYLRLAEGRWPFRVAVLIAWLRTPKKYRWPKTQQELANQLGLSSDRQFTVWRARNPQIDAMVHEAWRDKVLGGLSDSIDAMLEVASLADYKSRGDRELHFKLADILRENIHLSGTATDLSKLSFEEKLQLAGLDSQEKLNAFLDDLKREQAEEQEDPEAAGESNSDDDGQS